MPWLNEEVAALTIGDVGVLAAADDSAPLMAAFAAQPEVASVIGSGEIPQASVHWSSARYRGWCMAGRDVAPSKPGLKFRREGRPILRREHLAMMPEGPTYLPVRSAVPFSGGPRRAGSE